MLFKSEKGPFRNKKRMKLLRKELHETLKSTVPAYTDKSILESYQNVNDQVLLLSFYFNVFVIMANFFENEFFANLTISIKSLLTQRIFGNNPEKK